MKPTPNRGSKKNKLQSGIGGLDNKTAFQESCISPQTLKYSEGRIFQVQRLLSFQL